MSRSLTSKNIRNFVPVLKPKISNDFPSPLTLKLATPSFESAFTLDSSFENFQVKATKNYSRFIDSKTLN